MDTSAGLPNVLQRILLSCGILAPLLYLGTDLLAGKLLKGYSFSAQSMGELGAAGSPTRPLVVALTLVASAFMLAFGIGVWRSAGSANLLPRIVAGLILGNAVAGLAATLFFPNHFGVRPEFGTPGVLLMFLSVLCFVLAMIFGAVAFHGWMRILSIAIPAAYVILAILRFAMAASSAAGAAVLIGTQERTMAYSFLLWTMALAIFLLLLSGEGIESAINIGR
ncbi:MAG: DUF998 domain-containing protein [Chloroflexota bacterium]